MLALTGCVVRNSVAEDLPPKQKSYAIEVRYDNAIGESLIDGIKSRPRQSAFRLITDGTEAFFARVALIRLAEHSLDLQYYIVEDDLTGSMLLEEILRKADEGVRIRLLVDSLAVSKVSKEVSLLVNHPKIFVRVFNPVSLEDDTFLTTIAGWMFDFERVNRRMHNKALIADNLAAIIGGRNLGDQYFGAGADFNFSDMDVVAAGPIVPQISASFDHYWNSEFSVKLADAENIITDKQKLDAIRLDLRERWQKAIDSEAGKKTEISMKEWMMKGKSRFPFVWAYADLAVDSPDKVDKVDDEPKPTSVAAAAQARPAPKKGKDTDGLSKVTDAVTDAISTDAQAAEPAVEDDTKDSKPLARLDRLLGQATKSFTVISAYMVPRERGVKWLGELADKGIKIRILTNSLDSTDVPAVHSGYAPYRADMLRHGIELYEMKTQEGKQSRQNLFGSRPRSSLHAKTYIVDGEHLVVASFNLDPRSIEDNTELALTIHSAELAGQAIEMFEETTSLDKSYHVSLENPDDENDNNIIWRTREGDKEKTYSYEPAASLWRRAKANVYRFLPIEDLL